MALLLPQPWASLQPHLLLPPFFPPALTPLFMNTTRPLSIQYYHFFPVLRRIPSQYLPLPFFVYFHTSQGLSASSQAPSCFPPCAECKLANTGTSISTTGWDIWMEVSGHAGDDSWPQTAILNYGLILVSNSGLWEENKSHRNRTKLE